MKLKVVYSDKQVADPGPQPIGKQGLVESPSARKPREMAKALQNGVEGLEIEFVPPEPMSVNDLKRCHSPSYVDGVFGKVIRNGFGTFSASVNESLPYTNGAMYTAAKLALGESPTCALVAGFHHAGYSGQEGLGNFCTFNGLMATAMKLVQEDGLRRVMIMDCDMHWGNGTDDILAHMKRSDATLAHLKANGSDPACYSHITFGKRFFGPVDADKYLEWLAPYGVAHLKILSFKPQVILYQSGADVHVHDPYGGVLDEAQMKERDLRVFRMTRQMGIPLAWCLAGGYQVDPDGGIGKVVNLHLNTFKACAEAYSEPEVREQGS